MPTSFDEIENQVDSFIQLGQASSDKPFKIKLHSFGGDMFALKLIGENYEFLSPMYEINPRDLIDALRRRINELRSER